MAGGGEQHVFRIGETFASFSELEEKLRRFKETEFIDLYRRDSKTIEKAKVKRHIKPELKFYRVKYACVFGGRKFKSFSQGKRSTSTIRNGCPFYVLLGASEDRESLRVTDMNIEHNHEISEVTYKHLPNQRKLDPVVKSKAKQLIKMQVNKKILQQQLSSQTGQVITLRDLTNLQVQVKAESTKNDLWSIVNLLQEQYGTRFDVPQEKGTSQGVDVVVQILRSTVTPCQRCLRQYHKFCFGKDERFCKSCVKHSKTVNKRIQQNIQDEKKENELQTLEEHWFALLKKLKVDGVIAEYITNSKNPLTNKFLGIKGDGLTFTNNLEKKALTDKDFKRRYEMMLENTQVCEIINRFLTKYFKQEFQVIGNGLKKPAAMADFISTEIIQKIKQGELHKCYKVLRILPFDHQHLS